MEEFLNLNVDLKEFGDIYNSYTDNKLNFGGGYASVRDLLINARFKEDGNIIGGKITGGNLFYKSFFLNDATNNNTVSDNIFHSMQPLNNTTFTDVTSAWDMSKASFEYPTEQANIRSFVF